MRKILTDVVVHKTKPPAEIWDLTLPGFGLRITPNNACSFFIMYRIGEGAAQRQRRMTIGNAALLELGEARERARKALQAAKDGVDPQVKVAPPQRTTFRKRI